MDKSIIEAELQSQRKAVNKIIEEKCLKRYAVSHIDFSHPVQLVRGVRGAGKTFSLIHALVSEGKRFAYVDLSKFKAGLDPDSLYESLAMVYGDFETVIIDECSGACDAEGIFRIFNENRIPAIGIYSGMQLLNMSGHEIPTTTLYPLSFSEYCIWHDVETEAASPIGVAAIRKAFNDYLTRGGFPAMQQKIKLARTRSSIENAIIENDLRGAFRKDKIQELHDTAKLLLGNSSELINYKKIAGHLDIGSEITAKKYVEAIKDSGCLYTIARFGQFSKQRTISEKVYLADPSLITEDNRQKKLEDVVYMQLRRFAERHGYKMHYYANRTTECDFALCINQKMRTIIQVIADYSDTEVIKEKVKGLIAMSKATRCNRLFILTDAAHDKIETKDLTVTVMPVYDFLLDKSHKIVTE